MSDYAIRWRQFYPSLINALDYLSAWIETEASVQVELDATKSSMDADGQVHMSESCLVEKILRAPADSLSKAHMAETDTQQVERRHEKQGGIVSAAGSSVDASPGTSLGNIMKSFGSNIQSLDYLPKTPVTITRQSLYPTYWPYRLHIGTHRRNDSHGTLSNVYVYYTLQTGPKPSIEIHADEDGGEIPRTFERIQEIDLFEPFCRLVQPNWKDKNYERLRLRYLVQYYFAVAAHWGLVEELPVDLSHSAVQILIKACNAFDDQSGGSTPMSRIKDPSVRTSIDPSSRATRNVDKAAKGLTDIVKPNDDPLISELPLRKTSTKSIVRGIPSLVV